MKRWAWWSWLRRLFFRKPAPPADRPRAARRLGVEHLEDRAVPAASLNQTFVAVAYEGLLGRDADAGGLAYWAGKLDAGSGRAEVVGGILGSREFADREVQQLYRTRLDRTADDGERGYWAANRAA